jgi:hypothetical protein
MLSVVCGKLLTATRRPASSAHTARMPEMRTAVESRELGSLLPRRRRRARRAAGGARCCVRFITLAVAQPGRLRASTPRSARNCHHRARAGQSVDASRHQFLTSGKICQGSSGSPSASTARQDSLSIRSTSAPEPVSPVFGGFLPGGQRCGETNGRRTRTEHISSRLLA